MNSRSTARGLLLTRPTLSMISVGIKLEHLVVKFAVEKSKQVGQNPPLVFQHPDLYCKPIVSNVKMALWRLPNYSLCRQTQTNCLKRN
jgi:hypothetical protein